MTGLALGICFHRQVVPLHSIDNLDIMTPAVRTLSVFFIFLPYFVLLVLFWTFFLQWVHGCARNARLFDGPQSTVNPRRIVSGFVDPGRMLTDPCRDMLRLAGIFGLPKMERRMVVAWWVSVLAQALLLGWLVFRREWPAMRPFVIAEVATMLLTLNVISSLTTAQRRLIPRIVVDYTGEPEPPPLAGDGAAGPVAPRHFQRPERLVREAVTAPPRVHRPGAPDARADASAAPANGPGRDR